MLTFIDSAILAVTNVLYQPFFLPLILVAGGLFFTWKTGLMQLRLFREALRVILAKPEKEENISSFGALMLSTASRVGTGNIIGVSTAICLGGPGSIFWMWVTAFLGGATAFIESTLAQIYKKKDEKGACYGGPAYYMQNALGQRWMGVIFSFLIICIYAIGYNMLAAYNLQSTFAAFSFYDASSTPAIIGIIITLLFGCSVLGGAKRLTRVTEMLVPVMGVLYVLVAVIVILINYRNIPSMFYSIFSNAFDFRAIFGGLSGSCFMYGVKRGLYSNEAGMGSAPNASAKADVAHPAAQGLVQMISVFIDTLLICSATALMCLSTNVVPEAELAGAGYVQLSMEKALGASGPIFIAVSLSLFAFTTLIGNYSYCEGCIDFILKRPAKKSELLAFRLFASTVLFLGFISSADLVWDLADMLQGLIVCINMPAIFLLHRHAIDCLKDYTKQRASTDKPRFHAKDIGLKEKLDFWE